MRRTPPNRNASGAGLAPAHTWLLFSATALVATSDGSRARREGHGFCYGWRTAPHEPVARPHESDAPDQRRVLHARTSARSLRSGMKTPPTTERAWKPRCLPVVGVVPVGQRHARRATRAGTRRPASTSASKSSRRLGERRRPDDPVELRVRRARVERQAVLVLLRQVERDLLLRDVRREEVQVRAACPRRGCTSGSTCRACRTSGGSGRRRRPP